MYEYMCIRMHTHIYMYLHTYIHTHREIYTPTVFGKLLVYWHAHHVGLRFARYQFNMSLGSKDIKIKAI